MMRHARRPPRDEHPRARSRPALERGQARDRPLEPRRASATTASRRTSPPASTRATRPTSRGGRARQAPRRHVVPVSRGLDVPRRQPPLAAGAHRGRGRPAPLPARHRRRRCPETIAGRRHMDRVLRHAHGRPASTRMIAIQMATLNGAEYFGLRHDLGSIAPGRPRRHPASSRTLGAFRPHRVLADGRELGRPAVPTPTRPRRSSRSGSRGRSTRPTCGSRRQATRATVRAIGVASGARHDRAPHSSSFRSWAGRSRASAEPDVARAREHRASRRSRHDRRRLRQGTRGCNRGAVASSIAHDNHNLLVAGMSDADMLFARRTAGRGGRRDGGRRRRRAARPASSCPIAGLMSRPARPGGRRASARRSRTPTGSLGSPIENPSMIFSFPLAGRDPGAAADQQRAGRRRHVRVRRWLRQFEALGLSRSSGYFARRFCCGAGIRPFCMRSIARRCCAVRGLLRQAPLLAGRLHPCLALVGGERAQRLSAPGSGSRSAPARLSFFIAPAELGVVALDRGLGSPSRSAASVSGTFEAKAMTGRR